MSEATIASAPSRTYTFNSPLFWSLRDQEGNRLSQLEFHLVVGDYFGTLATTLQLVATRLGATQKQKMISIPETQQILDRISEDLCHLQKEYRIEKKQK